jgi:uncharacterized OsmC-like protein
MTTSAARAEPSAPTVDEQVLYHTVAHVRAEGRDKRVTFPVDGAEAVMGLNGGLADFYGAAPDSYVSHASTLDYVAAAAAACLLGTFRKALSARGVAVDADALTAEVSGDVVVEQGVPLLKRIRVQYQLSAPPGADKSLIERAHSVHHKACAVSRSLEAAIAITTELQLT